MEAQTIQIHNEYDIVFARKRTREIARTAGLDTIDQARISVAVSTLAQRLRLGNKQHGQIVIECLHIQRRPGVRVTITMNDISPNALMISGLEGARALFMLDELNVKPLSDNVTEITAVKWAWRGSVSPAKP